MKRFCLVKERVKARLRAERQGEIGCTDSRENAGLRSFHNCWRRTIHMSLVLEGFSVKGLVVIRDEMDAIVNSRWEMTMVKFLRIRYMTSWASSAYR